MIKLSHFLHHILRLTGFVIFMDAVHSVNLHVNQCENVKGDEPVLIGEPKNPKTALSVSVTSSASSNQIRKKKKKSLLFFRSWMLFFPLFYLMTFAPTGI